MPTENWERIQEVFLAAADLPAEERALFLQLECSGDAALRREVESLLAYDGKSADTISLAVKGEASLLFDNKGLIGERLGAYRVVSEIGRGGMGSVYLATRDDAQFHKRVAIKVVKRGMDTVEVLRRFRHERQILATLDHPFIARLLDGGTTGDGRPFFVMEHVAGQPVDAFVREHQFSVPERCRLFLQICEAVSYAHRNLVVHRDLKPGNIFVSSEGVPKLLDFGVSKVLSADTEDGSPTATQMGGPLTPEYASPEQVRGLRVTTATDIYSLGAVLYELLTGRRAQNLLTRTAAELDRVVCEAEVDRPSLHEPGLDSDLDNIVMMAMRKDPARRYASVDQFADDIRRHLAGRPVMARQDSLAYRSLKFVRRNGLTLAASAVVVLSLLVGVVVAFSQAREANRARALAETQRVTAERERGRAEEQSRRAEAALLAEAREHDTAGQERDQAIRERARAEQRLSQMLELSNRSLFDVHGAIEKLPGALSARREIVRTTLEYLQRLEKEAGLDDRLRVALSAAYYKVGDIQGLPMVPSLGDTKGAQASYRLAESLLAPVFARRPKDPEILTAWIDIQEHMARIDETGGEPVRALKKYEELIPPAEQLARLLPRDLAAVTTAPNLHSSITRLYTDRDRGRALEHARLFNQGMLKLQPAFPGDASIEKLLANSYATLAGVLVKRGDLTAAESNYRSAIELREKAFQRSPADVMLRRDMMIVYANYGGLLYSPLNRNLGRPDEARRLLNKTLEIARELVIADSQNSNARRDLANALTRFSLPEPGVDGARQSLSQLDEGIGIFESLLKDNPRRTGDLSNLSLAREYAGRRLQALGEYPKAEAQYLASMKLAERILEIAPDSLSPLAQSLADEDALAGLFAAQGDGEKAVAAARRGVDRMRKAQLGSDPERRIAYLGKACLILAETLERTGDAAGSRDAAAQALAAWRRVADKPFFTDYEAGMARAERLTQEVR